MNKVIYNVGGIFLLFVLIATNVYSIESFKIGYGSSDAVLPEKNL